MVSWEEEVITITKCWLLYNMVSGWGGWNRCVGAWWEGGCCKAWLNPDNNGGGIDTRLIPQVRRHLKPIILTIGTSQRYDPWTQMYVMQNWMLLFLLSDNWSVSSGCSYNNIAQAELTTKREKQQQRNKTRCHLIYIIQMIAHCSLTIALSTMLAYDCCTTCCLIIGCSCAAHWDMAVRSSWMAPETLVL